MDQIDQNQCDEVAMLFIQFGADSSQAQTMARQLIKRSRQIALERDLSELEALETLLKQVIEAREGS
jgi:hypothetical protein